MRMKKKTKRWLLFGGIAAGAWYFIKSRARGVSVPAPEQMTYNEALDQLDVDLASGAITELEYNVALDQLLMASEQGVYA